jgi:hypothetical protein
MFPQSYLVGRDTGEDRPITQPMRKLPLAKQADVGEMLGDMQTRGVIEESESPWLSPVVLVQRFCVLQETERHEERLFPIAPVWRHSGYADWSQMILHSGSKSSYWQVDLHPEPKEKTAFSTR